MLIEVYVREVLELMMSNGLNQGQKLHFFKLYEEIEYLFKITKNVR